jgi:hypothetical protein
MSLLQFLTDVSQNETTLEAFTQDPERAMAQAGLSDDEKAAVRSGDREAIAALVEPEATQKGLGLKVKVKVKLEVQITD